MNPVYYVFLVIIVLSFITGLIITFIDNKNGIPIDKELPKKQVVPAQASVQDIAVRSNNLNDTMKNMPPLSPYTANVVPYLPVENTTPSFMVEQSPVVSQQNVNQGFDQVPSMNMNSSYQAPVVYDYSQYQQPVVNDYSQYQQPVVNTIEQNSVNPEPVVQSVPVQPDFQSMIQQPSQNQIQIDNINNNDVQNYYSVPVLIPMSMDDDSL